MRPILQTLLLTLFMSVWVDPQGNDFSLPQPRVRQALALANYLMRRPLGARSIRRDCRLLPARELETIFDAIRAAKRDTVISQAKHAAVPTVKRFGKIFFPEFPAGNSGKSDLPKPFHSWKGDVFLLWLMYNPTVSKTLNTRGGTRYEKMLRMYEPTASLCFWDSTLEPETPSESTTFTPDLFGTADGQVNGGPGHRWTTPVGVLTREHGVRGRPMNLADIENVLSKRTMGQISFPNGQITANCEELHNFVHMHVGGHMGQIETAAYDPIFWFHHTFIDCIYEWFRNVQKRRGRVNVERDWPREWGESAHGPFRPMRLGSLRNIDGQNEFFSRRVFRCERVPRCRRHSDCGTHMTCERRSSRCVSRTGATQSNRFFQDLLRSFGNQGAVGSMRNVGNMFGGNSRGFTRNNGRMAGGFGVAAQGGFGGGGQNRFGGGGNGGGQGGFGGRGGFGFSGLGKK